jgi:hypothetical protein
VAIEETLTRLVLHLKNSGDKKGVELVEAVLFDLKSFNDEIQASTKAMLDILDDPRLATYRSPAARNKSSWVKK